MEAVASDISLPSSRFPKGIRLRFNLRISYMSPGCMVHMDHFSYFERLYSLRSEKGSSRKPISSLAEPYAIGPGQSPLLGLLGLERFHNI